MTTFRLTRKFAGPSWLVADGGDGELLGYALDELKDAFLERLRQGHLARFPQNDPTGQTTAPEDALAALGRDRGIVRGIDEPAATYAIRLIRALDDHRTQGNPFALMQQLRGYCGPNGTAGAYPAFRTVDVRGNWFSLDADGTQEVLINQANWDWDAAPDALIRWSRFWVIIYPNGVWSPSSPWGDASKVWGAPGTTWGTTATPEQVASVRAIVADWKPAGTRCVNVIIAFDNASFDPTAARDATGMPDGTWGHWGTNVGGVYVPARLSTARYWDGV